MSKNKNKKKTYKHNLKKENNSLETFLANFEHEDKTLQHEVRKLASTKMSLYKNPKSYTGSLSDDFQAMIIAELLIGKLKGLRKELGCSAAQLDIKLGYQPGYPMSSLSNTRKKPTAKNWGITSKIDKRMMMLFPDDVKKAYENMIDAKNATPTGDKYLDITEILEDVLLLHGYNKSALLASQIEDDIDVNTEKIEQENKDMIEELELIIDGERIIFNKSETALNIIKKIKNKTNINIEVFETIKEQIV